MGHTHTKGLLKQASVFILEFFISVGPGWGSGISSLLTLSLIPLRSKSKPADFFRDLFVYSAWFPSFDLLRQPLIIEPRPTSTAYVGQTSFKFSTSCLSHPSAGISQARTTTLQPSNLESLCLSITWNPLLLTHR